MPEPLRENTEGIKTTNQSVARNTTAMAAITQTMQDLGSTLQQESSPKKPMQDLAALGPTFSRVAALGGPMQDVADLRDPMIQLAALKPPLKQVAGLEKPLSDTARLEEPLTAAGQLSQPLSALTRLTPVQLAEVVIFTTLGFFTLLFLTVWGAVRLVARPRAA